MGQIKYACERNVAPHIKREVKRVVNGFKKLSSVEHDIDIQVYSAKGLFSPEDMIISWGTAQFPRKEKETYYPVLIDVAGMVEADDQRRHSLINPKSRYYKAQCVGLTILHELAHYERFRDGKSQTEKGITTRAKQLYKQINQLGRSD